MANRETSDALSSLAANVLKRQPVKDTGMKGTSYNLLLADAKSLAGSVLSQDEHKGKRYQPSASTTAYEMVAAAEQHHVETTETLIHMIAATVLMQGIGDDTLAATQAGEAATVSFSPADMDEMHRRYEMTATRDGMITTVSITPRSEAEMRPSLALRDHDGIDDAEPAEPRAEAHTFDRPLWGARIDGKLFPASDQAQAERLAVNADVGQIAQVENRFCYHPDCPAERCNHDNRLNTNVDVNLDPTM